MTKMFEEEFDPLNDLNALKHNQIKLITHIKELDAIVTDFAHQILQLSTALQGIIREQSRQRVQLDKLDDSL